MNIDPNAYLSTPPALIRAAKNNAYYIGRLTQHLANFDKDLAEWKASGEWKKDYKSWGAACDVALGITKQWADKLIKRYNATESPKEETIVSALFDNEEPLETVNDLPNPMAAFESGQPESVQIRVAALKPKAVSSDLENGESVADYKRTKATPTESGKPKYALSVWKDLQEFYGHALNRIHDAHRAVPNAERRDHMLKTTKALMSDAEIWKEEAR